jgi:tetratricopeptide (TPR) repeat protein
MTAELQHLISNAEKLAKAGDDEKATLLAEDVIKRFPDEMEVWALRAYLYARRQKYEQAIADLTRAIEINSLEPFLFHDRGRYELMAEQPQSAVNDFGKGLDLCDSYGNDYYRESLHFHRAEAFLMLGKKREALSDLSRVREDYRVWIRSLRTRTEMLAECGF